ncbi:hypothetical protein LJC67_06975 [Bacteroidales bacterium OttesenSCG-928-A14]|nr:hypothetical protein [Bacteroidales bacterium OttesenSCG-928-A14]
MVDVKDIIDALKQSNFSNQRQIEILHILKFILYEKEYPNNHQELMLERIELLKLADQNTQSTASNVRLSDQRGYKTNFIRIINCMCELAFFIHVNGNLITKKEVFGTLGKLLGIDLSTYQNHLSATKAAGNNDMQSTLHIFDQLYTKQLEINQK